MVRVRGIPAITQRRAHGYRRLNGFNPVLAHLLHSNHDVRCLFISSITEVPRSLEDLERDEHAVPLPRALVEELKKSRVGPMEGDIG